MMKKNRILVTKSILIISFGISCTLFATQKVSAECGIIERNGYLNIKNCHLYSGSFVAQYVSCNANQVGGFCCVGIAATTECANPITPTPSMTPTPTLPPGTTPTPTPVPFNPFGPVTTQTLDSVNPLLIAGGEDIDNQEPSAYAAQLSTPGGIISRALTFIFPLAGLALFALLVWGGFEMLAGAPSKKSMDAGKQRITAAFAGFLLLFAAYWIWQIVQIIFGVKIL